MRRDAEGVESLRGGASSGPPPAAGRPSLLRQIRPRELRQLPRHRPHRRCRPRRASYPDLRPLYLGPKQVRCGRIRGRKAEGDLLRLRGSRCAHNLFDYILHPLEIRMFCCFGLSLDS